LEGDYYLYACAKESVGKTIKYGLNDRNLERLRSFGL